MMEVASHDANVAPGPHLSCGAEAAEVPLAERVPIGATLAAVRDVWATKGMILDSPDADGRTRQKRLSQPGHHSAERDRVLVPTPTTHDREWNQSFASRTGALSNTLWLCQAMQTLFSAATARSRWRTCPASRQCWGQLAGWSLGVTFRAISKVET